MDNLTYLQMNTTKEGKLTQDDWDEMSNNDKKVLINEAIKYSKAIEYKDNTVVFTFEDCRFNFIFSKKVKNEDSLLTAYKNLEDVVVEYTRSEPYYYKQLIEQFKDCLEYFDGECPEYEGEIFDGMAKEEKLALIERLEKESLDSDADGDKYGCYITLYYPSNVAVTVFSTHSYGYYYEKDNFCKRAESIKIAL